MTRLTDGAMTPIPTLNDRYEVGELLGEGAVGCVYAARDTLLGIDVAVKVMRPEFARYKEYAESFSREATLATRMLSPHVVKVLGLAVTAEGAPCVVYEHLAGETLACRLMREGTLGLADTAKVVKQTALALARAHSLGVVHRDVKPDNIFLVAQPDGRFHVKLIDFGIAETMSSGAASHDLRGTPEYIAPEILFATHDVDARVDLYALGVVAFECLTGRCPYPGETIDDVFLSVRSGDRASLAELRPDLGYALDEWMERALHPDPFFRFSTARELGDAMQAAVEAPLFDQTVLREAA